MNVEGVEVGLGDPKKLEWMGEDHALVQATEVVTRQRLCMAFR